MLHAHLVELVVEVAKEGELVVLLALDLVEQVGVLSVVVVGAYLQFLKLLKLKIFFKCFPIYYLLAVLQR